MNIGGIYHDESGIWYVLTEKAAAQNTPAPVTTYALFRDGQFLTQSIRSDKKFPAPADLES